MTLAAEYQPAPPEAGFLDADAFEFAMTVGERLFNGLLLEQPLDDGADQPPLSSEAFWRQPVLAEALDSPDHLWPTLQRFDSLIRVDEFSPSYAPALHSSRAHYFGAFQSELLLDTGLGDKLVGIAEANPDTQLATQIADLLFMAMAQTWNAVKHGNVEAFLHSRVPAILENAEQRAAHNETISAANSDTPYQEPATVTEEYGRYAAELLVTNWNQAQRDEARDALRQIALAAGENRYARETLHALADADGYVDMVASVFGIHGDQLRLAWMLGYGDGDNPAYMSKADYRRLCVERLLRLEAQEHGSAQYLNRYNGIRNFGRFSEEGLLSQYQNRNTPYKHRVFLLSATADDTGGSTRNSMPKFEQMRQTLHDKGIGLTIVEVATRQEIKLFGRMTRIAQKLGRWPLAAVLMMDAHASAANVTLSLESLKEEDINEWAAALAGDVTRDDAVLFADCCSIGKPGGLAEPLSDGSNREVRAATGSMFLRSIAIQIDEQTGTPMVDVQIGSKDGSRLHILLPKPTDSADSVADIIAEFLDTVDLADLA